MDGADTSSASASGYGLAEMRSSPSTMLHDLADEMYESIAMYLHLPELAALSQTCRRWRKVLRFSSKVWRAAYVLHYNVSPDAAITAVRAMQSRWRIFADDVAAAASGNPDSDPEPEPNPNLSGPLFHTLALESSSAFPSSDESHRAPALAAFKWRTLVSRAVADQVRFLQYIKMGEDMLMRDPSGFLAIARFFNADLNNDILHSLMALHHHARAANPRKISTAHYAIACARWISQECTIERLRERIRAARSPLADDLGGLDSPLLILHGAVAVSDWVFRHPLWKAHDASTTATHDSSAYPPDAEEESHCRTAACGSLDALPEAVEAEIASMAAKVQEKLSIVPKPHADMKVLEEVCRAFLEQGYVPNDDQFYDPIK